MSKTKPEDPFHFEQAIERLETLVQEMETGNPSLDQALERFEEGTRLVQRCTARLDEVERRIEQLVQRDGQTTVEPWVPPEAGAAPAD